VEGESTHGRGAVLLIGPLLWDDAAIRSAWRDDRLDMDRAERVHAPVLYSRSRRDGRCVMALARRGSRDGGGTARAVPFRRELDLETEARTLWSAERGEDGPGIGATWGTVGALCRAEGPWRRRWIELVRAGRVALPHDRDATPLGADGLLDMEWPGRVGGGATEWDVILVALTVPVVPAPTAEEIGAALMEDEGARGCFHRNRLCGITTVRDDAIIREMRALVT
jgi:hypothetical protein